MAFVAGIVGFVSYKLVSDRETRRAGLAFGAAVFMFGSVVIQERLEHFIETWPNWVRGPRVGLEEGSELVGVFFLLYAAILHAGRRANGTQIGRIIPDLSRRSSLAWLLVAGFVAHVAITTWWLPTLDDLRLRGNPSALFPSLCFFVLAIVCHGHRATAERRGRTAWGVLSLLCLASSLGAVFNLVRPFDGLWPLSRPAASPYVTLAIQLLLVAAILGWGRLLRAGFARPRTVLAVGGLSAVALAIGADHGAVLAGALACVLAQLAIAPAGIRVDAPESRPFDLATDPAQAI